MGRKSRQKAMRRLTSEEKSFIKVCENELAEQEILRRSKKVAIQKSLEEVREKQKAIFQTLDKEKKLKKTKTEKEEIQKRLAEVRDEKKKNKDLTIVEQNFKSEIIIEKKLEVGLESFDHDKRLAKIVDNKKRLKKAQTAKEEKIRKKLVEVREKQKAILQELDKKNKREDPKQIDDKQEKEFGRDKIRLQIYVKGKKDPINMLVPEADYYDENGPKYEQLRSMVKSKFPDLLMFKAEGYADCDCCKENNFENLAMKNLVNITKEQEILIKDTDHNIPSVKMTIPQGELDNGLNSIAEILKPQLPNVRILQTAGDIQSQQNEKVPNANLEQKADYNPSDDTISYHSDSESLSEESYEFFPQKGQFSQKMKEDFDDQWEKMRQQTAAENKQYLSNASKIDNEKMHLMRDKKLTDAVLNICRKQNAEHADCRPKTTVQKANPPKSPKKFLEKSQSKIANDTQLTNAASDFIKNCIKNIPLPRETNFECQTPTTSSQDAQSIQPFWVQKFGIPKTELERDQHEYAVLTIFEYCDENTEIMSTRLLQKVEKPLLDFVHFYLKDC